MGIEFVIEMMREIMMIVGAFMFILYLCVFLAVTADLVSGVRKAKQRGEARRSKAYRRTIDKMAKYYNVLFALSIIDAMQLSGVWYLDRYWAYNIPLLPLFTLIGALFICAIEIKSIYEKADEKDRADVKDVAEALTKLVKDRNVNELMDWLNEKRKEQDNG